MHVWYCLIVHGLLVQSDWRLVLLLGYETARASEAKGRSWRKRIAIEANAEAERRWNTEQYSRPLARKATGNGGGLVVVEYTGSRTRTRRSKLEANILSFICNCNSATKLPFQPSSTRATTSAVLALRGQYNNSSYGRDRDPWDLACNPCLRASPGRC